MVQIWKLLPNFCRYNSQKLSQAFASLIVYLEPMVNKNLFGLRSLALKVFSELIQHCRTTSIVDDQIKLTRQGLQRICMGYIEGLSKLYINTSDSSLTQEDMA